MAKKIDGIKFIKTKEYAYCNIEYFSDELKSIIRAHLSEICHGTGKASTGRIMYSYETTIKEFLNRYEKKTTKIKKGLIGELLTHIIISEMFPEYRVISPYFNLEERSIKIRNRGFGTYGMFKERIEGEALERLRKTSVGKYEGFDIPGVAEAVAKELMENDDLVINFAGPQNSKCNQITEALRKGKMIVDWLKEWRDGIN